MRLVCWNVDGLQRLLARGESGLPAVHRALGEPDVLCLQEVRLRPGDRGVLRDALPGYVTGESLCEDAKNGRFRGGRTYGVLTFVRAALAPAWLERPAWDREGRVVSCALPGFTLCNAYAPNGTSKPYFDPDSGLASGTRSDFKLRFQQQLLSYLEALMGPWVLLGDWNVSRSKLDVYPRLRSEAPHVAARSMWNDTFLPTLDLVDAFRALHPAERAYTWFSRAAARKDRLDAARVDYALVSRALMPRVAEAGIAQELAFKLGSDHAPLSLELRD